MKKAFKLGFFGLLASFVVTSCDTREDWFKEEGEGATFVYQNGDRLDTIDMKGLTYVEYKVNLSRVTAKEIWSDTINLTVYGVTGRQTIPAAFNSTIEYDESSLNIQSDKTADGKLGLWYDCGMSSLTLFASDTAAAYLGDTRLMFTLTDLFGNNYLSYVRVHLYGDCPPMPVLTVKDVDGKPLEKVLSLKQSYDKDGTVTKYEYCIDGNIVNYKSTANRFECISGVWQGGKSAYGGTYITATTLEEVNHAFQTTGEHTVYYRCMDNLGAWSTWQKETITITE